MELYRDRVYVLESEPSETATFAVAWQYNMKALADAIIDAEGILSEDLVKTIGITIDGGGSVITTGSKGWREIEADCTIIGATIVSDISGNCIIDVKKSTYANFPTTTSITASSPPTLSSARKNTDTTLTGWTTSLSAGDILEFVVNSASTVTKVTLFIRVRQ